MVGLVLEGGTFRPIFSCGVMDALLDNNIEFPYVIGVSAGIADSVSYISKQKRRNIDILLKFRHNKKYVGFRNLFTDKSLFGFSFIYEEIPQKHYPFDFESYFKSPAIVKVGVTNALTGQIEYLNGKEMDQTFTMLKASCALPVMVPAITINGTPYYDGGLTDSIPAKKAIDDGNEKLLIILTQPEGYKKELGSSNKLAAKILKRKYPNIVDPLLKRHIMYNNQLEYCNQLEKQGKAIVLRPSKEVAIDSLEKDLNKIEAIYDYGYQLATENIHKIKSLFK